jgi:hypothetical protein
MNSPYRNRWLRPGPGRKPESAVERINEHLSSYNPLDDEDLLTRIRRRVFGCLPEDKDMATPPSIAAEHSEVEK